MVVCLILSCEALIVPVNQKGLVNARKMETKLQSVETRMESAPDVRAEILLGLLSFDLDDTLFSISETINDANEAMIHHMNQCLLHNHDPCGMDEFIATSREIRKILQKPITYTELRKISIRRELEKRQNYLKTDMDTAVHAAFDAWLTERHAAAERYLFDDTVSTLQSLRERYPDTCFAAITNGLGNPLQMVNSLALYFDFCVSGEEQDIFPHRKPHSRIYQVALQRYRDMYPHHHHHHHHPLSSDSNSYRYVWCHVGDCLANDVGASGDCGAWAVWYAPDNGDADREGLGDAAAGDPPWLTASKKRKNRATEIGQYSRRESCDKDLETIRT